MNTYELALVTLALCVLLFAVFMMFPYQITQSSGSRTGNGRVQIVSLDFFEPHPDDTYCSAERLLRPNGTGECK